MTRFAEILSEARMSEPKLSPEALAGARAQRLADYEGDVACGRPSFAHVHAVGCPIERATKAILVGVDDGARWVRIAKALALPAVFVIRDDGLELTVEAARPRDVRRLGVRDEIIAAASEIVVTTTRYPPARWWDAPLELDRGWYPAGKATLDDAVLAAIRSWSRWWFDVEIVERAAATFDAGGIHEVMSVLDCSERQARRYIDRARDFGLIEPVEPAVGGWDRSGVWG